MSQIFIAFVPGGAVSNNTLCQERNDRGAQLTEVESLTVPGRKRPIRVIRCNLEEFKRLRAMPDCAGLFSAYRRDDIGRITQIYPPPPKKKVKGLSSEERHRVLAGLKKRPSITTAAQLPPPKINKNPPTP